MRHALILLLAFLSFTLHAALPPEKRIVFLGDSITQGGGYVEFIEAALIAQHPDSDKEIIPLGLSSETVMRVGNSPGLMCMSVSTACWRRRSRSSSSPATG